MKYASIDTDRVEAWRAGVALLELMASIAVV